MQRTSSSSLLATGLAIDYCVEVIALHHVRGRVRQLTAPDAPAVPLLLLMMLMLLLHRRAAGRRAVKLPLPLCDCRSDFGLVQHACATQILREDLPPRAQGSLIRVELSKQIEF